MATFSAQIVSLVGGTPTQSELDVWCTEGAKEIIRQLPADLQKKCATMQTFTSVAAGSEDESLDKGNVLSVFAGSYNCRLIPNTDKYKASDSGNVLYATSTDPAYYLEADKINVLPASLSCKYEEIQYPSVDADVNEIISNFPDEAEHLVVLYAAMKQLLEYQNSMTSSWQSDITTAITAVNTALDRVNTHVWDDEGTFLTGNSQLTRVKAALDDAEDVINADEPSATTDAYGALSNEDTEIMSAALQLAQVEIGRASAHLGEWSAIGGMAIQEANGFIAETSSRLQLETTKYQWYGDQYAKLSAEYARGLAALKGT